MLGFLDSLINWLDSVSRYGTVFFFGFMAGYLTAVGFLVFDRHWQARKKLSRKLPDLGEDEKQGPPDEQ